MKEERRSEGFLFCLTVVDDAVFQQGLSQVDALVRFADLPALYQPRHKLTGDTGQRRFVMSPPFLN